jgi:hypothetical protein
VSTPLPERIAIVEPAAGTGTGLGADFTQVRMLVPAEIADVLGTAEPRFACVGVAGFTDAAALAAAVAAVAAMRPGAILVERTQPGSDAPAPEGLRVHGSALVSGRSCAVLSAGDPPAWLRLEPADAPLPAPDPLSTFVPYTRQLDARISAAEAQRDALAERLVAAEADLAAARSREQDLRAQLTRMRRSAAARLPGALRTRRAGVGVAAVVVVVGLGVLAGWLAAEVAAGLVAALLLVTLPALGYLVLGLRRVGRSVGRVAEQVRAAEATAANDLRTVRGRLDWLQQAMRNDAERATRIERKLEIVAATTVDTAHALGDRGLGGPGYSGAPPDERDISAPR